MNDANVLCKQLYNSSVDSIINDTSTMPNKGVLSNFKCTGNEVNILDCGHDPWGDYDCTLPNAGVKCKGRCC